MRPLHLLCALILGAGSAFAAEPAGVYSFLDETQTAQDCARACDEDTLCVAWRFEGVGKCGLLAVAPGPNTDSAVVTGISVNAPAFVRRQGQLANTTQTTQAAPAAEPAPQVEPAPEPSPQAMDDTQAEAALLGGPDDAFIRSRLR